MRKGGRPKSLVPFNYRDWRKRHFLLQTLDQHVKMLVAEYRLTGRPVPTVLVADTIRGWERKRQASREFLGLLLEIALAKSDQHWLELRSLLARALGREPEQAVVAPTSALPYTDEEYIAIKEQNLWHKVDPFRLAGRGRVLAITSDGPASPPVPLPAFADGEISESVRLGERVVCKAQRDIEVEDMAIGQGQLFTLGVTHWTELCLANPRFSSAVDRITAPTKSQALEAERLPVVRHTQRS